ncbi:MAG: DUF1003 domain-containing protein [Saprospiraceae bacterium]
MTNFHSDLSRKVYPIADKILASTVRKSLLTLIQSDHPEFTNEKCLSISELNFYREKYIANYLSKEIGELTQLEKAVLTSITDRTIISDKLDLEDSVSSNRGQRIADKVASFGGSWTFISSFGIFLVIWILVNVLWFANKGFDPYPFILLNLILSCIAAMQAPVIMMSQNRQEEKDRERSKKDYMINLKSELEIRTLHEKLDHLIMHQQQELLEIQKIQIEMMNDILTSVNKK